MESCIKSIKAFEELKHIKEFTEDARGVLPHGLLTSVWFKCSLKALGNIVATRLCCQAQPGEWQPVVFQMRTEVARYLGADVESFLRAPIELNKDCGFHASNDKPCRWRGKDMRDISKAEWGIEVEDTRSAQM
jgi:thymidylate synthase ThyX